jgi:TRAP-type C4-dicarboxylate transport system permease small subunit
LIMSLDSFDHILRKIEKVQLVLCVFCVAGVAVIMFSEVFLRNFMGINLQWALELSALLMVWTCFIGSSVIYRRKGHIGIEALVRLFPLPLQVVVNSLIYLLIAIGFVILVIQAASLMVVQYGQEMVSLGIPRSALSLPIVIGTALMLLASVYLILEEILRLTPRHDARKESRNP